MVASYEQVSFPYGAVLGLALGLICLGFVIFFVMRLIREQRSGRTEEKRGFRIFWCIGAGVFSLLLLFISWNSLSVQYRLQQALRTGAYESWTGSITDVTVENKGKDFHRNDVYKITLTLDNSRCFTCSWLTPEQILLLQKGSRITVGCASQIGSVTTENGLTVYQSPDARGNVVRIDFEFDDNQ